MTPVLALAFSVFGGLAFWTATGSAPAFVAELQRPGITGGGRLQYTSAMYDRGAYLFQLGVGYVNADALSFGGIEASDEVATAEVAENRAMLAETYLTESLRLDPANAHAWTALAQAMALQGKLQTARDALLRASELAPTNPRSATARVILLQTVSSLAEDSPVPSLTAREQALLDEDLAVLKAVWPRTYAVVSD